MLLLLVAFVVAKASGPRIPNLERSTRPYLIIISLVFVASLLYSIYETARSQPTAYFITPTRVWELAAGGLLAFLPAARQSALPDASSPLGRLARIASPISSWAAWGAIIGCALLFNSTTAFPGYLALIPVAATAYLLWLRPPDQRWSPQRLSEMKPIQWLGDISYPLYLWHWPLITVFLALRHSGPGPRGSIALIAAALLLAWLTKRWVEDPVRFRIAPFSRPRVMLPVAAAGIALVLATTVVPAAMIRSEYQANYTQFEQLDSVTDSCLGALALINHCDSPFARTSTVDPGAAREDSYIARGIRDCAQQPNMSGDLQIDCILSDPSNPKHNAVLLGDSFSAQIAESLGDAAQRLGWRLHQRTLTGCTGFVPDTGRTDSEALRFCLDWSERTYGEVRDDPTVDVVIISARSLDENHAHARIAQERIAAFVEAGKHVVVVHTPPGFTEDVPACVERTTGDDPCTELEAGRNDWLASAAVAAGAELLELRALLCPDGVCHTVIGGTVAYLDEHHLTHSFTSTLSHWFEDSLDELISRRG